MKLLQSLVPAVLLLVCAQAFAGAYNAAPVYIDIEEQWAEGNLIAARFSDNDAERIGCAVGNGVLSPDPANAHYAYCEASLVAGESVSCLTYDPAMIDTIASINSFSYVYFRWNDEGMCTHVTVATRSTHIPGKLKP